MAPRKSAPAKSIPSALMMPTTPALTASTRKPWIKKTPVDVVLDQIGKQEKKVADMRAAVAHEERALEKLIRAKEVLEER